ncbi:MAG: DUF3552 domain-containing protein, partial [Gemmatimonadetes bacterium]|nr:DUF3552 domain-containing protein [Gemmatimonadota bacterium]
MDPIILALIGGLLGAAAGFALAYFAGQAAAARVRTGAEEERDRLLASARTDADNLRKAEILAGKEEAFRAKEEWEREEARRRDDMERSERRIAERSESLDRKLQMLEEKIQAQDQRAGQIGQREKAVEAEKAVL